MNRQRIGDVAETMLGYFENNKTFQTDKIMTVPSASFTDSDHWRAEMDVIFRRVPQMLALSCEIPRPGDYKAMEAMGLPILIARDKAGTVRAFLNVCAHRWAPVAADGYGNCTRFTCPFHGWTYGADGRLIGISDRAKFGEIDTSTRGLKELPCEERHGLVFVCLTPGTPLNLDGYYGALLDDFADAGLKDWAFLGSRVREGANWKITVNNFLEAYHFATLHAKTFTNAPSNMAHYEGFGPNIRFGFPYSSIAKLREMPRAQWDEQEGRHFGAIRFLFPNVTGALNSEPSIAAFTQSFPGPTPDKSRIVLLFARKGPPVDGESERESIENQINDSVRIGFDEDVAIGLHIQKGIDSGAQESLVFGHNERGNQYFHEWLNWYLQGDPTQPKPVI